MPDENSHDCCEYHHAHHQLSVKDLCVSYRGHRAIENISFQTSCGNRLALIGPNGAGKSTLLKTIAGLIKRECGNIEWRGEKVKKWSHEFAYLPQREEIDWNFPITLRGVVEMGRYPQIGMFGKFSNKDKEAVDVAIEAMNLTDIQNRQIKELSGGQQQRAFIARSIAQEAHVLLLDEPFTGLDRKATQVLGETIHTLAEQGRLIIASHHDMATVNEYYNQSLLLNKKQMGFGLSSEIISENNLNSLFAH